MAEFPQENFAAQDFDGSRFNLHRHLPQRTNALLVLLHGLSGFGYKTWGELPRRVFEGSDGPGIDVAVYDYVSGLRRGKGRGTKMPFWRRQLKRELMNAAENYEYVFIMGHSMGGVLAEVVAKDFLEERAMSDPNGRADALAALILVAAPRAGSGWALPGLKPVVPDFRYLSRLADAHAEVSSFFTRHTEVNNVVSAGRGQRVMPRYAVVGGNDRFVSSFSASFGIPDGQILPLAMGHSEIAKPEEGPSPLLQWLHAEVISQRVETLTQARRERMHIREVTDGADRRNIGRILVTEFSSDPLGMKWEEAYKQALRAVNQVAPPIFDVRDARGVQPGLHIAVHDSSRIISAEPSVISNVDRILQARRDRPSLAIGLAPVGAAHVAAAKFLDGMSLEITRGNTFYIEGARDPLKLVDVIARFMYVNAPTPEVINGPLPSADSAARPITPPLSEGMTHEP